MPKTKSRDERVRTDGYEVVAVDTLEEYPGNPRRGDVDAIRESIRANGVIGSIIVQTGTRRVLSGNHTLKAIIAEGIEEVPVTWADVDDDAARKIVLAMNRAADLGYYDNTALADLLRQFGDDEEALLGTLYGSSDLDALMHTLGAAADGDDIGDTHDARTPAERAEDHHASPIRSIVLPLSVADYEEAVAMLVRLRRAWQLETNAEVVLECVRLAESEIVDDADADA